MFNELVRELSREIVTELSLLIKRSPFKNHVMLMGKSPLFTIHCTPITSPVFIGVSPKVNGIIWGGTVQREMDPGGGW